MEIINVSGTVFDISDNAFTVNYGKADVSAIGDTVIQAAVANKRIRVLGLYARSALAVTLSFKSNATKISADLSVGINDDFVLPISPHGWFQTNVGEELRANQSGAVATGVIFVWIAI